MSVNTEVFAEGITFTALPDPRFKTARLSVGMFLPLNEQTAAAYALLPVLLTRATAKTPTLIAMHRRLSRLYGAAVTAGVQRLGDCQLLTLTVQCIDNRFTLNGEDVAAEAAALLLEMLFCPHLSEDGLFDAEDFAQEKRCLLERIAAQINDKRMYARSKAEQLLAPDDVYSVSAIGTEQTAAALTRETVTATWKTLLQTARFHWFYAAADTGEAVKDAIKQSFTNVARHAAPCTTKAVTVIPQVRRGNEKMTVAQAKLTLGFCVDTADSQPRTEMAARLVAALFGGSPNSLLFRNVREKMSLCYYCRATFDRIKGVMMVDCGVDAANVALAEKAILEQLQVLKDGAFSKEDLQDARLYLKNVFLDKENLQGSLVLWLMGQSNTANQMTPREAAALLDTITADEIAAVAKTVTLQSAFAVLPEGGAV